MTRQARMAAGAVKVAEGMFVLILSLLMWRLTLNLPAWAVLFLPGAALLLAGVWEIFR